MPSERVKLTEGCPWSTSGSTKAPDSMGMVFHRSSMPPEHVELNKDGVSVVSIKRLAHFELNKLNGMQRVELNEGAGLTLA